MSKQIEVNISENGAVEIDAKGFKGNSCSIATHELEVVLSVGEGVVDKKKPEYYSPDTVSSASLTKIDRI